MGATATTTTTTTMIPMTIPTACPDDNTDDDDDDDVEPLCAFATVASDPVSAARSVSASCAVRATSDATSFRLL